MAKSEENSITRSRPRLRTLEQTAGERHASWLELFFDLVFVLAVAQLAQIFAKQTDLTGTVKFLALFVPIWWTWVGFTFYADRFESEEATYRILVFAAMFAVAALSLTLENAFTIIGGTHFVVCYVALRLLLIALYARSAFHIPLARELCFGFIKGFSLAVFLWLASLLLPPPFRYALWAAAVILELATPLFNVKSVMSIPINLSHIPERFGLFTIIVLGEAVVATANGASQTVWNVSTIGAALLGFALSAAIWWINFDFVEDTAIKSGSIVSRFVYLYGHFFIVASIIAIGIGVEHAIIETGANETHLHFPTLALLGGGIAVYLAIITAVKLAAENCNLLTARLASTAVALALIFVGQFLHPLVSLAIFLFLLGFGVWLESRFGEVSDAAGEDALAFCEHADQMQVVEPGSTDGCEECVKNNYKWVHLRLCTSCGHIGCCDSSQHKHATRHFHETDHPIVFSLEADENWAWCYTDDRFVPQTEGKV